MLFLAGENSLPLLFAARFVQGLASGAAFSVGSAWLQDLVGSGRAAVAARRASLALNIGFAAGPLTGGLLGQYAPRPLVLPYLVHVALVIVLVTAAVTIARRTGAWTSALRGPGSATLLPHPRLGRPGWQVFLRTVAPTAVCVYAFPSVAVTVLPLPHRGIHAAVAFTGVLAAVALASGALVQPIAHRFGNWRAAAGAGLGCAGYALGLLSVTTGIAALAFVAGFVLGAGGGLCLNAGLIFVQELSDATTRGATNGLFYTFAYIGFATPLLCTSFVSIDHLAVPLIVLTVLAGLTSAWLTISPRPVRSSAGQQVFDL